MNRSVFIRRMPAFVLLASLLGAGACSAIREKRAASKCRTEHSSPGSPMLALFGTEGVREMCDCTIAKIYKRLPDADRQVARWLGQIEDRREKRGLLGVIRDSSFFSSKSTELATFFEVYGGAWSECAVDAVRQPSR